MSRAKFLIRNGEKKKSTIDLICDFIYDREHLFRLKIFLLSFFFIFFFFLPIVTHFFLN